MERRKNFKFNVVEKEFNLLYIKNDILCSKNLAIKIAERSVEFHKDNIFFEVLVKRGDFTSQEAISFAKKTGIWSVLKSALERNDFVSINSTEEFWKKILVIQHRILKSGKNDIRILWWQAVFLKPGLLISDALKYEKEYEQIETE